MQVEKLLYFFYKKQTERLGKVQLSTFLYLAKQQIESEKGFR